MLRKIILSECILLLLSLPVPAFQDSDIDYLENSLYRKLYSNESLGERLARLENDMLGMAQSGDIETRVNKLLLLTEDRYSVPPAFEQNKKNSENIKKHPLKNFFNGLSDIFSQGGMTGFTPSWNYPQGYQSYNSYSFNNDTPGLFDYIPTYSRYYDRRPSYNNPVNSNYYNHRHISRYPGFNYPGQSYSYGTINPYNRTQVLYSPTGTSSVKIIND